jgi:hypothetical protein
MSKKRKKKYVRNDGKHVESMLKVKQKQKLCKNIVNMRKNIRKIGQIFGNADGTDGKWKVESTLKKVL